MYSSDPYIDSVNEKTGHPKQEKSSAEEIQNYAYFRVTDIQSNGGIVTKYDVIARYIIT